MRTSAAVRDTGGLTDALARAALDALQANVFIADPDLNLIYVNPHGERTLRSLEPSIREAFGLGVRDLAGGSIHRFHRDPQRVERILRDPASLPHTATMQFGEAKLITRIAMVRDRQGDCAGYVVCWDSVGDRDRRADAIGHGLAGMAETLNAVSQQLSASAEQASVQANVVAAGAEELSASIREIASSANQAAAVSQEAVEAATSSTAAVSKLGESSTRIGEVVKLIAKIASQTNLLALNATIEAARAGDAGRGFAVVANEVKELAKQTGTATDEIASMVSTIQQDVHEAVAAIDRISGTIDRMSEFQSSIAAAVDEQTATAKEIAHSVVGVADASKDTSAAAVRIHGLASDLEAKLDELRRLLS